MGVEGELSCGGRRPEVAVLLADDRELIAPIPDLCSNRKRGAFAEGSECAVDALKRPRRRLVEEGIVAVLKNVRAVASG